QRVCCNYVNHGRGLSLLPTKGATPIYSLHYARSGSDTLSASAYPVSDRPYHSHRPLFCPMLVPIFMSFRGPLVMACTLAQSPSDPSHRKLRQLRCLRRFDATGWNEPVPGRELHPLKSPRLSRRTFSPTTMKSLGWQSRSFVSEDAQLRFVPRARHYVS